MQNIKTIINNYNMNLLHQNNKVKDECNCRNKKHSPLGGKSLLPNIVYKGKITSTQRSYYQNLVFLFLTVKHIFLFLTVLGY